MAALRETLYAVTDSDGEVEFFVVSNQVEGRGERVGNEVHYTLHTKVERA